jgi:hypothetical protein
MRTLTYVLSPRSRASKEYLIMKIMDKLCSRSMVDRHGFACPMEFPDLTMYVIYNRRKTFELYRSTVTHNKAWNLKRYAICSENISQENYLPTQAGIYLLP